MFNPIRYDAGQIMSLPLAVSQTVVKGDALKPSSGYLAVCSTGSYQDCKYVSLEDVTTDGSSHTLCQVIRVKDVQFEADCDDVVSIVDRFTYADFASKSTINPDASSYNDFFIEDIVGTPEVSTKVIGRFTETVA